MSIYTPYTYLIGWSKFNKWYYGVRYATKSRCLYETGCHPDDFWKTYFTSSNVVESFIEENGDPDIIKIRRTFNTAEEAIDWEHKVLLKMDILNSGMWLNIRPYTPFNMGGWRLSEKSKAKTRKPKSKEHAKNISKGRIGILFSDTHIENLRAAATGIKQTDQTIKRRSRSMSKLKWWNDGTINIRSITAPDHNWSPGRCGTYTQKIIKICPHCGKTGKGGAMSRWHFDNCRHKK